MKHGTVYYCCKGDHRRRLHRGSGKIAPVPTEQPGQKYHFAPVLFCPILYRPSEMLIIIDHNELRNCVAFSPLFS